VSLYDLNPGDRVQIFHSYGRKKPGDGGDDAVVVKKGRVLITVTPVGYHREEVFRMETGRANDGYGHSYIKTPEQVEHDIRESAVRSRLHELGVRFELGVRPSIEQLEAIIKIMEESEGEL
jgi:hypothetical protein